MQRTELTSLTYRGYRIARCELQPIAGRGGSGYMRWEILRTVDGTERYVDQAATQNQAQLKVDKLISG